MYTLPISRTISVYNPGEYWIGKSFFKINYGRWRSLLDIIIVCTLILLQFPKKHSFTRLHMFIRRCISQVLTSKHCRRICWNTHAELLYPWRRKCVFYFVGCRLCISSLICSAPVSTRKGMVWVDRWAPLAIKSLIRSCLLTIYYDYIPSIDDQMWRFRVRVVSPIVQFLLSSL